MSRAAKPLPICALTIGYETYIMPFSDGVKVAQLMQGAIHVETGYAEDYSRRLYRPKGTVEITIKTVSPSELMLPGDQLQITQRKGT